MMGFLSPYGIRLIAAPGVPLTEAWPTSEREDEYVIHPDDFAKIQADVQHAEALRARRWAKWKGGAELLLRRNPR